MAEEMNRKTPEEIQAWEAEHGMGAAWGPETHRADILVTDPEGHRAVALVCDGHSQRRGHGGESVDG